MHWYLPGRFAPESSTTGAAAASPAAAAVVDDGVDAGVGAGADSSSLSMLTPACSRCFGNCHLGELLPHPFIFTRPFLRPGLAHLEACGGGGHKGLGVWQAGPP